MPSNGQDNIFYVDTMPGPVDVSRLTPEPVLTWLGTISDALEAADVVQIAVAHDGDGVVEGPSEMATLGAPVPCRSKVEIRMNWKVCAGKLGPPGMGAVVTVFKKEQE